MWRKVVAGTLGYILTFGTVSWAESSQKDGNNLFKLKKETEYNFLLTLYAVGKYEWNLKKNLLAKTINCVKDSKNETELQKCINEFKSGLKEIRKSVELYSQKFSEELRRKE